MITIEEKNEAQRRAAELIVRSGFVLAKGEVEKIEVADFGLSRLSIEGAQILTLVQTDRIGAKIIVMLPGQTLPEHRHPQIGTSPGKEEVVRVLWGSLFFYVVGTDTMVAGHVPDGKDAVYTLRHEIVMMPGDQIHCRPDEKHWFQAGSGGAVAFSFSSTVHDTLDVFTDPQVRRVTVMDDSSEGGKLPENSKERRQ